MKLPLLSFRVIGTNLPSEKCDIDINSALIKFSFVHSVVQVFKVRLVCSSSFLTTASVVDNARTFISLPHLFALTRRSIGVN